MNLLFVLASPFRIQFIASAVERRFPIANYELNLTNGPIIGVSVQ